MPDVVVGPSIQFSAPCLNDGTPATRHLKLGFHPEASAPGFIPNWLAATSLRRFDERNESTLQSLCFHILRCGSGIRAQYTAFKSADAVLLISNRPGQYFSVDLPWAED